MGTQLNRDAHVPNGTKVVCEGVKIDDIGDDKYLVDFGRHVAIVPMTNVQVHLPEGSRMELRVIHDGHTSAHGTRTTDKE